MTFRRWQLPESALRASFFATQLTGLAVVEACAWAIRAALHLSAFYPLAAGLLFTIVMLTGLGFLSGSHACSRFGSANQITTIRAMLVALIAALIGELTSPAAATLAVSAGLIVTLLDGVDGWLARRDRTASAFGARFDMEVDALLILVLSILAWRCGKAGVWILASGLLRYLFVATGAVVGWLREPLCPSRRRQTICVVQVGGLLLVVAPFITPPVSVVLAAIALVVSLRLIPHRYRMALASS